MGDRRPVTSRSNASGSFKRRRASSSSSSSTTSGSKSRSSSSSSTGSSRSTPSPRAVSRRRPGPESTASAKARDSGRRHGNDSYRSGVRRSSPPPAGVTRRARSRSQDRAMMRERDRRAQQPSHQHAGASGRKLPEEARRPRVDTGDHIPHTGAFPPRSSGTVANKTDDSTKKLSSAKSETTKMTSASSKPPPSSSTAPANLVPADTSKSSYGRSETRGVDRTGKDSYSTSGHHHSMAKPRKSRSSTRTPSPKLRTGAATRSRPSHVTRSPDRSTAVASRQHATIGSTASEFKRPDVLPCRLHVARLTRHVTADHIKEIFGHYGNIVAIDMPRDRMGHHIQYSRGFAYVEYETPNEAAKAQKFMNGGQIDGQEIIVAFVVPSYNSSNSRKQTQDSGHYRKDETHDNTKSAGSSHKPPEKGELSMPSVNKQKPMHDAQTNVSSISVTDGNQKEKKVNKEAVSVAGDNQKEEYSSSTRNEYPHDKDKKSSRDKIKGVTDSVSASHNNTSTTDLKDKNTKSTHNNNSQPIVTDVKEQKLAHELSSGKKKDDHSIISQSADIGRNPGARQKRSRSRSTGDRKSGGSSVANSNRRPDNAAERDTKKVRTTAKGVTDEKVVKKQSNESMKENAKTDKNKVKSGKKSKSTSGSSSNSSTSSSSDNDNSSSNTSSSSSTTSDSE